MTGLSAFTFALKFSFACEIVMAAVCLGTLASRRLIRPFPMLCTFLTIDLIRSAWLFTLWVIVHDPNGYAGFYRMTQPLLIGGYGLLVMEALFRQASHFPKIGVFATTFCGLFAAVSCLICLGTAGIGITPSLVSTVMKAGRFYNLLCLLTLATSRLLFGLFSPRMRANVRSHLLVLIGLFAGGAVTNAILAYAAPNFNPLLVAGQMLTVLNPLTAYFAWTLCLTPAGEWFERIPYAAWEPKGKGPNLARRLHQVRRALWETARPW